jgi:DNA mismatch repair protein MLH1
MVSSIITIVVKELVENSIDADATQIRVSIRDGGLGLIEITDNGKGVRKADFPLLC